MNRPSNTVKAIGEQGLLQRLQRFCPSDMIGDDAAVLNLEKDRALVVTTDMLVDGVHFSDRTTSPEDAGWRAAAANLSDLAAMGASPVGITVALGLPGEVAVSWVEALYQGLWECLQCYQTPLVGGDICRSSVITISITAFGQVEKERTISRFIAQPGDAIAITGFHGCSRAGLELLLHPEYGQHLDEVSKKALIQAHQRPKPRLDVLQHLDNDTRRRIAGMDSSDGLADAVLQLCRCSGVGARVDRQKIPLPPALRQFVSPEQALDYALYGGEDFELVLCLPPPQAEILIQRLGNGAAIVGMITEDSNVELIDSYGIYSTQTLTLSKSFQHF
ncbi:thiamine-phosphate kinase [Candidatus Gracilibacteria bacterium]|nr:thiamine-phosphate kinase [Candidatus Gracilibacteria bacterium]NJP17943.1 thiamine-phosphate kinase [Hydrococcus sp. CRU_1_1]